MSLEQVKQVIGRAVLDPQFRELLLNHPEQAVQSYDLTAQEQAALQAITPEQLDQFAAQIQQQFGPPGDANAGIKLTPAEHGEVAKWNFENAWPSKVSGPSLDAAAQKVMPGAGADIGGPVNSAKADFGDVDGDGSLGEVPGEVAKSDFENAWPSKVSGPSLDKAGDALPGGGTYAYGGGGGSGKVSPDEFHFVPKDDVGADGDFTVQKVSPADAAGQKVTPGQGGEMPMEQFSLNFEQIKYAYPEQKEPHPGGSPPDSYDVSKPPGEGGEGDAAAQKVAPQAGGDVAMEELHLSHEGLEMGDSPIQKVPGRLKWNDITLKRGVDTSSSDPEWKYVPVRRFSSFLQQSLSGGIKWAVFEPGGRRFVLGIGLLMLILIFAGVLVMQSDAAPWLCGSGLMSEEACPSVPSLDQLQCGDGQIDPGEQCDGNLLYGCISGQVCSDTCGCIWVVDAADTCGNGIKDPWEECDYRPADGEHMGCSPPMPVCDLDTCTCTEPPVSGGEPAPGLEPTEPPVSTGGGTSGGSGEEPTCGDGVCDPAAENSDLCAADCQCADDGVCQPGEGANCLDCGANAGACGSACSDSAQCAAGLSCAGGVCWDACACGGDCASTGGDTGGACPCTRVCTAYDASGACQQYGYRDCNGAVCRP